MQHAQQLGLHRQRQLADFVQQQRAAVGQLELAAALAQRAGERAAHVPEQLAFDQVLRQGGAVERNQRLLGTVRAGMDGLRDQFLADAGLAADQHRQVRGGHRVDLGLQAAHGGAVAAQLAGAQRHRVLRQGPRQLLLAQGLLGEAADALADRHDGAGQPAEAFQQRRIDRAERLWIERIQRQQAPGMLIHVQRATHAVVHFELAGAPLDQAVVGVWQLTVGGQAGGSAPLQQRQQARVIRQSKTPAERVVAQARYRQRAQRVAFEAQQRRGITGEKRPCDLQQALVRGLVGRVPGQGFDHLRDGGELLG